MIEIDGRITLWGNTLTIDIEDFDAMAMVVEVRLTEEQFVKLLAKNMGHVRCELLMDERNFARFGKKMICKKFEFPVPKNTYRAGRSAKIKQLADENLPEGWFCDYSFGSQDSFFDKDGQSYARTIIRKWVDKDENNSE